MKLIRVRKDAFVFGFSLKPEIVGVPEFKKYHFLWLGCFEIRVHTGKYKFKSNGGK